jgi:hypothetical protein
MKVHLVMILVCTPLLWLGCSDKRTSADKKAPSKVEIDSLSKVMLQIFSINRGDDYKFDSTCLCFYGSAAYDLLFISLTKSHPRIYLYGKRKKAESGISLQKSKVSEL